MAPLSTLLRLPLAVLWRALLVRLPRLVPLPILHYTSPLGPHPVRVHLPSRDPGRSIPVLVFLPPTSSPSSHPVPVHLDFHGGGFVLGSCLEEAPFCARFARELGAVVISVDYRLGPVDKFPAAVHDAEDVLHSVLSLSAPRELSALLEPQGLALDREHISLGGFSSGGNLALNLAQSVEGWASPFEAGRGKEDKEDEVEREIPLVLFYPSFDARLLPSQRTRPPNLPLPHPFWASLSNVLIPTYLPRRLAAHPRASPGLAPRGSLLPGARVLLVLPELDTLAGQSGEWVDRMEREGRGGDLRVRRVERVKHGWTQMPDRWLGEREKGTKEEVYAEAIRFLRGFWEEVDAGKQE